MMTMFRKALVSLLNKRKAALSELAAGYTGQVTAAAAPTQVCDFLIFWFLTFRAV